MVNCHYIMQNSPPKQKNQITQKNTGWAKSTCVCACVRACVYLLLAPSCITGLRRIYTEARYNLNTLISYTKIRSFALNIPTKSVCLTQCSSVMQATGKCPITM
jgi:hypothetical protein